MYATALEMVIAFGADELAQMATPKRYPIVDDERLELAIENPASAAGSGDEAALEACLDAINQALAVTDGIIDSYIGSRYTLPLGSVPAVLREKALDLARYELHRERATEEVGRRRDQAIEWLKDLAAGKATLGTPALDNNPTAGSAIRIVPSAGRTFTAETLGAFGA